MAKTATATKRAKRSSAAKPRPSRARKITSDNVEAVKRVVFDEPTPPAATRLATDNLEPVGSIAGTPIVDSGRPKLSGPIGGPYVYDCATANGAPYQLRAATQLSRTQLDCIADMIETRLSSRLPVSKVIEVDVDLRLRPAPSVDAAASVRAVRAYR